MNSKMLRHFAQENNIVAEVIIPSKDELITLGQYHNAGHELQPGMEVVCEMNARTPLTTGILKSYVIGEAKYDVTGFGKYAFSYAMVEQNGKEQKWPFTMLWV